MNNCDFWLLRFFNQHLLFIIYNLIKLFKQKYNWNKKIYMNTRKASFYWEHCVINSNICWFLIRQGLFWQFAIQSREYSSTTSCFSLGSGTIVSHYHELARVWVPFTDWEVSLRCVIRKHSWAMWALFSVVHRLLQLWVYCTARQVVLIGAVSWWTTHSATYLFTFLLPLGHILGFNWSTVFFVIANSERRLSWCDSWLLCNISCATAHLCATLQGLEFYNLGGLRILRSVNNDSLAALKMAIHVFFRNHLSAFITLTHVGDVSWSTCIL